eukprot:g3813.t1
MDITKSTVGRAPAPKRLDRDMHSDTYEKNLKSGTFALPKGVTSLSQSFQRFELDKQEEKELEKMQKRLEDDKRKFEMLKDIRKKKQQAAMHARATELSARLSELEQQESDERFKRVELRGRLQKLREEEKSKEDRERELSKQLWDLERDHAIEEIAQLKMKAAAIRAKREAVTLQLDIADTHVATIEEERVQRGQSNYDRLKTMLSHADTLQQQLEAGGFDDVQKASAATKLLDQVQTGKNQGEGGELFKLSDEVENMRKMQREREASLRARHLKQLNEKRKELHDRQQQITLERRNLRLLQRKGSDALADIEFGHGPPLEFILANERAKLEDGEDGDVSEDTDSEEEPLDEFVETVTKNIRRIKLKMQEIKDELPKIPLLKVKGRWDSTPMGQPYNGYMGKKSYLSSQMPNYRTCHSLALSIVDETLHILFVLRPTRQDAEKAIKQLNDRKKNDSKLLEQEQEAKAMRWILQDIVDDEVKDICYSIAFERELVVKKSEKMGINLILKSFPEDQIEGNLAIMKNAFEEMIKRREKRNETSTSRRVHQKSTLTLTHDARTDKKRLGGKRASDVGVKSDVDKEEEKQELDPDVVFVPTVSRTLNRPQLPLYYVKTEKEYWKRIGFKWSELNVPANVLKRAGPISCLKNSPDGRFLFSGHEKGAGLLWDCFWKPPLLIRASYRDKQVPKEKLSPVVQVEFGIGGSGHRIATIDKRNIVRIWSTETIVKQKIHSKLSDFFPTDMRDVVKKPPPKSLIAVIDPSDNGQTMNKSRTEKALLPSALRFHPSITVTGQQPSLMIGLQKGLIVKHNLASDSPVLFLRPYTSDEIFNPLIKGNTKDPERIDANNKLHDCGCRVKPKVKREFFQAHTNRIIFLDFVGTASSNDDPTTTAVSVDESGHVFFWPYTTEGFSGFGWFTPSHKYKIRDHTTGQTETTKLIVKAATTNRARTQLILLCHATTFKLGTKYEKKPGDLRILFFDLQSKEVLKWMIPVSTDPVDVDDSVGMCISPLLDAIGSDVAYITHKNGLEAYSLATGQPLLKEPLVGLKSPFKLGKNPSIIETNPGMTALYVTAPGSSRIYIASVKDNNTSVGRREKNKMVKQMIVDEDGARDRVRLFTTGPEHRVRSIYWDISEHNVDREVEGIVYEIARDAATKAIHKAIAKRQKEREDERLKHQVAL